MGWDTKACCRKKYASDQLKPTQTNQIKLTKHFFQSSLSLPSKGSFAILSMFLCIELSGKVFMVVNEPQKMMSTDSVLQMSTDSVLQKLS